MRPTRTTIGSALFSGLVAVVIPWWMSRWQFEPAFLGLWWSRPLGLPLVVAGVIGLAGSSAPILVQVCSRPALIASPGRVDGLFRYVRNPMYLSLTAVILGQAVLFGNWQLLAYGVSFWLASHLFVVAYEEPALALAYKEEYARYCADVPRWIPRTTPWREL